MKPKLPRSLGKKFIRAAPLLTGAVAAPMASGAIIYTSVNGGLGQTISPGAHLYFKVSAPASIHPTYMSGDEFEMAFSYDNPDLPTFSKAPNSTSLVIGYTGTPTGYVSKLSFGATISGSSPQTVFGYFSSYGKGPWAGGGTGYVGLIIGKGATSFYGWANITYNSSLNELTLFSFAYQDDRSAIQAGAVPEPAEAAIVGGLLAGSAAAFAARRKRKLARAA